MSENSYDIIVIGGGPAGYVGAIRAGQLGLKVACVEARGTLGGTCLNVGCIPSKALLHATEVFVQTRDEAKELGITVGDVGFDLKVMQKHKSKVVDSMTKGIEGLFKKNKVDYFVGHGSFVDEHTIQVKDAKGEKSLLSAKNVLIATGSKPIELPMAPFDEKNIVSSTGALAFSKVPKHLVVIGGGVIGLELGSVWRRLGAEVTVIEAMGSILASMDDDVVRTMNREVKKQGIKVHTKTKFTGVTGKSKLVVQCEGPKGPFDIDCDKLLVAVGRKPNTDGLGLETIGIELDRGRIPVAADFRTKCSHIYAVGDVIDGPMLAHKAEEEAVACVENIGGVPGHVNYEAIPNVIYTSPEVASVGKTEAECREAGIDIRVGKFPFTANGRAKANGNTTGFAKAIADKATDRLLGVHIVGPNASEMIGEAVMAFEYKASSEDVARSVHAHPTLSEALKEACLGVDKRMINM